METTSPAQVFRPVPSTPLRSWDAGSRSGFPSLTLEDRSWSSCASGVGETSLSRFRCSTSTSPAMVKSSGLSEVELLPSGLLSPCGGELGLQPLEDSSGSVAVTPPFFPSSPNPRPPPSYSVPSPPAPLPSPISPRSPPTSSLTCTRPSSGVPGAYFMRTKTCCVPTEIALFWCDLACLSII